jgi:hypothetical protein
MNESNSLQLEWDEVRPVVEEIFSVWSSDSNLLLAQHAWEELAAAGRTGDESDLGRSEAIIGILAFGAYYREFCTYAFDEGSVGEWREWITSSLIGARPLLDASVLGEPADQPADAPDDEFTEDPLAVSGELRDIVRAECPGIIRVLQDRWGMARFFASLYATEHWDFDGYPLSDEAIDEIVNEDVTGSKLQAWSWVDNGGSLW